VSVLRFQPDRDVARHVRSLRRRFAIAIGMLVGIAVASTAGLVAFGVRADEPIGRRILLAFWDTLNLVSTVGNLEEEFTIAQRLWAMLVIIFGLGAVLYAFGTVQQLLHGPDVRQHIQRLRMQRRLDTLTGHTIVCGYGAVGTQVAAQLRRARATVVVVDRDAARTAAADADGHIAVEADATHEQTLVNCGVERAAGVIATLDRDEANVYLALITRELRPDVRLVSRASGDESARALRRAGADRVIIPGRLAGMQLSHLVLKPRVSDFITAAIGEGEYDFGEVEVREHAFLEGRSLRELDLPRRHGILVIAIVDADRRETFNPPADTRLANGDVLLVVSREGGLEIGPPGSPEPPPLERA